MTTKTTPRPRGLRQALKKRVPHETEYRLPLAPLAEVKALHAELQQAEQTAAAGAYLRQKNPERVEEVTRAVEAAQEAAQELRKRYDACFYIVKFRPLPSDEFDALVQLHPPTEAQLLRAREAGEDLPIWNEDTFYPELLERCAVNSDLSAAEWVEELRGWSKAERGEVRSRALEVNVRAFGTALSFG